jgi:hypothetical protein
MILTEPAVPTTLWRGQWSTDPDDDAFLAGKTRLHTQRNDIDDLRHDSPSLRPQVQERLTQQYGKAQSQALRETRLAESCPWTVEQVLDDDFWPDAG